MTLAWTALIVASCWAGWFVASSMQLSWRSFTIAGLAGCGAGALAFQIAKLLFAS